MSIFSVLESVRWNTEKAKIGVEDPTGPYSSYMLGGSADTSGPGNSGKKEMEVWQDCFSRVPLAQSVFSPWRPLLGSISHVCGLRMYQSSLLEDFKRTHSFCVSSNIDGWDTGLESPEHVAQTCGLCHKWWKAFIWSRSFFPPWGFVWPEEKGEGHMSREHSLAGTGWVKGEEFCT